MISVQRMCSLICGAGHSALDHGHPCWVARGDRLSDPRNDDLLAAVPVREVRDSDVGADDLHGIEVDAVCENFWRYEVFHRTHYTSLPTVGTIRGAHSLCRDYDTSLEKFHGSKRVVASGGVHNSCNRFAYATASVPYVEPYQPAPVASDKTILISAAPANRVSPISAVLASASIRFIASLPVGPRSDARATRVDGEWPTYSPIRRPEPPDRGRACVIPPRRRHGLTLFPFDAPVLSNGAVETQYNSIAPLLRWSSEATACGRASTSCRTDYRKKRVVQFCRRQSPAVEGKSLPNPYGSRFCAAISGGQTLRRICSTRLLETTSSAAIGRAELGHPATTSRRSTSSSFCSATPSWALACSISLCRTAMPRGGESISELCGSQHKSIRWI